MYHVQECVNILMQGVKQLANIWDEVEEVQEVKNTPQQQPTNDIWGEVEEVSTQPVEQATPVLTGRIEQKVIPNWDKKGRIYYTD